MRSAGSTLLAKTLTLIDMSKRQAGCVAAAALLALAGGPAAAQQILRASPLGPPGHLLNSQVLRGWADAVNRATAGRVQVQILPQAVSPPTAVLAAVRSGQADVALLSNGASAEALPLNAMVEFAGQTPSAERSSVAYQRVLTRYPAMGDEFRDVEVLAVFTHGPGVLLLGERVAAPSSGDWPLTLHAGSQGAAAAGRALGAKVELAAGPAAKGLMSEGRADGTITALEALRGFGLAPLLKRVVTMEGGFYGAGFSLLANSARWQSLSAEDREAIRSVSGETLARLAGRAWDQADAQALQQAQAAQISVQPAPPAVTQRIQAASEARQREWITKLGILGTDGESALMEYREEATSTR